MSTQRKIDSARANGAKSHGPITEEGRKKSSMNALKHGLTARTVVLSNEKDDEYTVLVDSYVQDLQPTDSVEMDHVVEMANAKWHLRRLYKMETEMFERQMDRQKAELNKAYSSYDEVFAQTYAYQKLSESGSLQMLNMASRLKRDYSRALSDLLRLRRGRESNPCLSDKKDEKRTESQERTPTTNHQPPSSEPRPQGAVKCNPTALKPSPASTSPKIPDPVGQT